jgi:hypothetical protein
VERYLSAPIPAMHKIVVFKFDGMHMHKILGSQNKTPTPTRAGIPVPINAREYLNG